MSDNIFTSVFDDPFQSTEEWFPLVADNTNAAPGVDMPSFAAYRRVRVAAFFFIIKKARVHKAQGRSRAAKPALTLVGRQKAWYLSDPA